MGVKRETMTDSETTNWTDTHAPKTARQGPGRPRSIPPELFETILQLYDGGFGLLATSTNGTVWDPRDQRCGRAWVSCLRVRL